MTSPWSGSDVPPGSDVPSGADVLPAEPPRRRRGRTPLLAALAGGAAVAVAGTAYATVSFLSGGGAQPEEALPAGVVAMAKVDLDPSAGQKIAVYRLAQKFPSLKDDVTSEDDVKDQLLSALFEDVPEIDYERDIASWVGDRAAVAALAVAGAEPQVLAAVAYTDRDEADAALQRIAADDPESSAYAFSENADYVLLGEDQAAVDAAATAGDVLADVDTFADDVDALDGDSIVTAWADLSALWDSLPEEDRAVAQEQGFELSGRVVVGGRAESDAVEVEGRTFALSAGSRGTAGIGERAGVDLVQGLPESTVAALGATDLGPGLAEVYSQLQDSGLPVDLEGTAAELGLQLPDDLVTLLGDQTALALF